MPVQYERDDVRRRVVITFPGTYQASDGLAAIERHHAEGAWTYGVLYDLRSLTGQPNIADLKSYMERDVKPPAGETRRRGPIAVLAPDPIVYGIACAYAAMGRSAMSIEVFRDWKGRRLAGGPDEHGAVNFRCESDNREHLDDRERRAA